MSANADYINWPTTHKKSNLRLSLSERKAEDLDPEAISQDNLAIIAHEPFRKCTLP